MVKKSCKKGYYYCFTSKKCKRIPKGWHVMSSTGRLMRDSEHQDENEKEGKKKNGNGNGANGNGNGNGESNGGSDGGGVSESKDHEVAMAQSQLKKSARNIAKLRKALGKKEKDIPAWMQAKITDTAHDTDAAAGYVDKMDEEVISEKRDGKSAKSKGYSLRDWFKGGGWVQAGGKYDGKPCARQPGQKTKPFCRDADDRANMSKKERSRRAAKKRREDPNPDRKGKAKMVTASYSNWRADLEDLHEIPAALAIPLAGAAAYGVYKAGQHVKKKVDKALDNARQNATLNGNPFGAGARQRAIEDGAGVRRGTLNPNMQRLRNSYEPEGDVVEGRYQGGGKLRPTDKIKMGGGGGLKSLNDIDKEIKAKQTQKNSYEPEGELVDEGKKDACYYKVKSRYSVWPSAYASGALVKCRKVGAKNWGNKTKKESYELGEMASEKKIDKKIQKKIKSKDLNPSEYIKNSNMMPGSGIPKKLADDYQFSNWRDDFQAMEFESVDIIKAEPLQPTKGIGSDMLGEAKKCWKGYKKVGTQKLFGKTYNRCEKIKEDWQKSNRNDGVDGMSQKSVDAYKRENPGSKLQTAVTGKNPKGKDKKRRKSFCARSKGQKDMHNIDCSKTPEKKICKARKRWRC